MTMKHFSDEWINEWCQQNGWTDLYIERCHYWAFPPGAVMPEPIPCSVLRLIKAEKGWSTQERVLSIAAVTATLMAATFSYLLQSPMPLVFAFAFDAIAVALLEVEDN